MLLILLYQTLHKTSCKSNIIKLNSFLKTASSTFYPKPNTISLYFRFTIEKLLFYNSQKLNEYFSFPTLHTINFTMKYIYIQYRKNVNITNWVVTRLLVLISNPCGKLTMIQRVKAQPRKSLKTWRKILLLLSQLLPPESIEASVTKKQKVTRQISLHLRLLSVTWKITYVVTYCSLPQMLSKRDFLEAFIFDMGSHLVCNDRLTKQWLSR